MVKLKESNKIIQCVNITDKNIKYVLLDSGKYKIDGKIINVKASYRDKEMVSVINIDDIRIINEYEYVEKYISGEQTLTVGEYENKKHELLSKKLWNEKLEESYWESLEDEFAYRKFISIWTPIKNIMQTISNPIEVEIQRIPYNTNNKYIKSCFLNGESEDLNLFVYDRYNSVLNIVKECFAELGMIYQEGLNCGGTANKKIWSNSSHSGIRFVVAFNGYVFDDRWDIRHSPKGTLQDLIKKYNEDREDIRKIITNKYNKYFGEVKLEDFDFDILLSRLNIAHSNLYKVSPKKTCINEYNKVIESLNKCITQITEAYK